MLLAPTGRAAKVITGYASTQAYTIHKKIYMPRTAKMEKYPLFWHPINKNTLFIVDEASMISDHSNQGGLFGSGALLDDLIQFVYSGHQCKLLLMGDTAQLPPVSLDISPALDASRLELNFIINLLKK